MGNCRCRCNDPSCHELPCVVPAEGDAFVDGLMEEDYSGDPRLNDYPEVQMTHAAAEPLDGLREGRGGGASLWGSLDSGRGNGGTVFSDGRAYRPLHASERTFYELLGLHGGPSSGLLAAHDGALAPRLGDFCPAYYGVRTAEQAGIARNGDSLSRLYIELEDVCADLKKPITCKLRMGTRGAWALEAEGRRTARLPHKERASLWREDLRRTSGSLGWLLSEAASASATEATKGLESLGDEESLTRFTNFLALAGPNRAERVAAAFLQQTQSVLRWFRSPKRRTKFYGSSLLFAFEGEKEEEEEDGEAPVALVRMLGFAYTTPMQEPISDGSGYCVGLLALTAMLRKLSQPGALYGVDALAEQPGAGLRQDPVLHDERPRGGAVIYGVVRCKFCILLETSTKGDDWVPPKGKLLPGESLEDAGRRLAKSEAGVADFEVEAQVATRVLVKAGGEGGASLRRYAFVFGTSTGRLEQSKAEVPPDTLAAPPAAAAQWSPWRESELAVPRMRAWVPLERVTGLVKQQWALCVLQAAWQSLLDARSRAVADAEHHRAIWEEEEAVEIASLQEMQSQWIPI